MNLIEDYTNCRKLSEQIAQPLKIEDYGIQVAKFASPVKWHLAHTTWFFEEMLLKKKDWYTEFNTQFSFLFNSYYNAVGNRVAQGERGNISRPLVTEVYDYRKHVDENMNRLIKEATLEEIQIIITGINHEQQHQELMFTDLKIALFDNPTLPVYNESISKQLIGKKQEWISIEEGVYEIGHKGEEFSYDNELGNHKTYIQPFEISSELVSAGEYLDFIKAGGYERFELWLDEGWSWVNQNNIKAPLYWIEKDDQWYEYTLGGLQKLNPKKALSHVSFYEANAFANWKGHRLPTEFEWEVSANNFKWGDRWEWTYSAYLPYPNFKIADGALGEYNGKFMINTMVLRGASCATSPNHSRNTYRNFFAPHHQWQYSGIRLIK